ncbi:MAG TPA: hypothetical protein VEF35_08525 [Candidatus Bathyarchaeia archaeon]|nr:hypothetical protein [Candidatus Bathyarchaeia archaeon]
MHEWGVSIVTTEKGIEGISAHNGEYGLFLRRVDARLVDEVAYLLENEFERAQFGANARKLLEAKHTLDTSGALFFAVHQRVLEGLPWFLILS